MSERVLHIPNYMYPNIGGIEQVSRDIVDTLNENDNIEQKVICFNSDAKDGDYVCNQKETVIDKVDGVDIIRCGCFKKVSSQSLSLTYSKELKRVITDFEPTIVIFHLPNPFVATLLEKHLSKNFRLIIYWHLDIIKQKFLRKLFHSQNLRLLERADKIVATSPNYIEGSPYLNKFNKKCIVIPNCIRPSRLEADELIMSKVERIKESNQNKIVCFGIGRHVPYKGFKYLVEASKYLGDEFKVYIGGKGPLTNDLKKAAICDKKIEFLGRVSDEDMIAYFIACDIFCFPSITKNEAFGIALAEGMYFGKPSVTFTIEGSGVNYVNLDGITGIECENRNSKHYADALNYLAMHEEVRIQYGQKAKKRVLENFMFDQFKDNIMKLINNDLS